MCVHSLYISVVKLEGNHPTVGHRVSLPHQPAHRTQLHVHIVYIHVYVHVHESHGGARQASDLEMWTVAVFELATSNQQGTLFQDLALCSPHNYHYRSAAKLICAC